MEMSAPDAIIATIETVCKRQGEEFLEQQIVSECERCRPVKSFDLLKIHQD